MGIYAPCDVISFSVVISSGRFTFSADCMEKKIQDPIVERKKRMFFNLLHCLLEEKRGEGEFEEVFVCIFLLMYIVLMCIKVSI